MISTPLSGTAPVPDRAEVVADVKRAGRPVTGEHPQLRRVRGHPPLDLGAAGHGGSEGVAHDEPILLTGARPAPRSCSLGSRGAHHRRCVAIPEPWATELQDYRTSLGDETAGDPDAHHAGAADRGRRADLEAVEEHLAWWPRRPAPFRIHLRGTGTFRPVSPVVFVTVVEGISQCEQLADAVRRGRSTSTWTSPTTRT